MEEIGVEHLEEKVQAHSVVYLLIHAASDSRTLVRILTISYSNTLLTLVLE